MTNLKTEIMTDIVQKNARKLETLTNISFVSSSLPEELELRDYEIASLTGHFIGYTIFSDLCAVRFNFKTGITFKSKHLLHSCDVWIKESSLSNPQYTVLLNPNAKSEVTGGIRTVADILLGKKTMLEKETDIRFLPAIIREKTENDIEQFIDELGIDNLKNRSLSQVYSQYSTWADAENRRIIPKPQFFRVFKDFLVKKRISSDTISTGHVYPGVPYVFKADPEEQNIFNTKIISNSTFLKAQQAEVLLTRIAQGDPIIPGVFICGRIVDELNMVKKQIRKANAQNKTVFFQEVYGFAGFISALWQHRIGKILVFPKADRLFTTYNQVVRGIIHTLLERNGPRIIQYTRPFIARKNETLNFLLTEAKQTQPKPMHVINGDFNVEDLMDAEDKLYNIGNGEIPANFEFKSKVIFLTNLPTIPPDLEGIPTAIELNYNKMQALSLVETYLEELMTEFPDVTMPRKREILTYMRTNKNIARHFDYSTFWHIAVVYMSGLQSWQTWALFQLSGVPQQSI